MYKVCSIFSQVLKLNSCVTLPGTLAVDDETESAKAGVVQPFRGRRSRFERASG